MEMNKPITSFKRFFITVLFLQLYVFVLIFFFKPIQLPYSVKIDFRP